MRKLFIYIAILFPCMLAGQVMDENFRHLLTPPKTYTAVKTSTPVIIDGKLTEPAWSEASWSDFFVDIEGDKKPKPLFNTRFKICWDDEYLYIAAWLEEPHINGKLHKRDEVIYYDNDFEVFIDPKGTTHNYFEIEINALNTVFDLRLPRPYRNGGWAEMTWDVEGLQHAVAITGTLNNPFDVDKDWVVEMAIPFKALEERSPKPGDHWNINFSRVQWKYDILEGEYVKSTDPATGRHFPEDNWVWSPQGVINMHFPERWGYLFFAEDNTVTSPPLPAYHLYKKWLFLLYYKQKEFFSRQKHYSGDLKEFNLQPPEGCELILSVIDNKFKADLACGKGMYSVNQDGLFVKNHYE